MWRTLVVAALFAVPALAQSVQVYETYGDRSKLLERRASNLQLAAGAGQAGTVIAVDDATRYQTMDGFGASITHSAASVISKNLTTSQRRELFRSLFDPTYGAGISLLRQPMGASDFSARGNFSYDDAVDPTLANFSIAPDQEFTTPLLREAIAANPSLRLLALPWSPPAWMKTNGSMNNGGVRTDQFPVLAQYFVKFLQAYQKERLPVYAISMQNEPLYGTNDYPSALVSATDQAFFIGKYLGPALVQAGFRDTKILAYDHNWDHPEYPQTVLADADARQYLAGSSFHCYGGDVSAQSTVKNAYPDKDIWFTECSGTVGSSFSGDLAWNARNLLIGATRNWARSVILWNIALDQTSGPINGGCRNCRGVVTIDTSTSPPTVTRNVEYYVLGHLGKFVRPGAVRIDSTSGNDNVYSVAFRNPDASVVLLVLNDHNGAKDFRVTWHGAAFAYTLPGKSVATFVWNSKAPAFSAAGVVNAADVKEALSPGALFTVFGAELAALSLPAPDFPLPWTMDATSITVNGRAAPILYLSPAQVNAQVPWESETGTATVAITRNGETTSQTVTVSAAGPGLFTIDGRRAAAFNEDMTYNTPATPLPAGQTILLFGTGLGPVSPGGVTGESASGTSLSWTTGGVQANIAGHTVRPAFSGLAPLWAGLYQVNVVVPPATPPGQAPVSLSVDGVTSNEATIEVR